MFQSCMVDEICSDYDCFLELDAIPLRENSKFMNTFFGGLKMVLERKKIKCAYLTLNFSLFS